MSAERHLAGVGVLTILNLILLCLHLVAIAILVAGWGPPDWLGLVALGAPVIGLLVLGASFKRPRMGGVIGINAVILIVYLVILWTLFRGACWGSCGDGNNPAPAIDTGRPA